MKILQIPFPVQYFFVSDLWLDVPRIENSASITKLGKKLNEFGYTMKYLKKRTKTLKLMFIYLRSRRTDITQEKQLRQLQDRTDY